MCLYIIFILLKLLYVLVFGFSAYLHEIDCTKITAGSPGKGEL